VVGWHSVLLFECSVSQTTDPKIFRNNFTKKQLPMIFGREDSYSFVCRLWVRSLLRVEKHLCIGPTGFHRNSSTIAG